MWYKKVIKIKRRNLVKLKRGSLSPRFGREFRLIVGPQVASLNLKVQFPVVKKTDANVRNILKINMCVFSNSKPRPSVFHLLDMATIFTFICTFLR